VLPPTLTPFSQPDMLHLLHLQHATPTPSQTSRCFVPHAPKKELRPTHAPPGTVLTAHSIPISPARHEPRAWPQPRSHSNRVIRSLAHTTRHLLLPPLPTRSTRSLGCTCFSLAPHSPLPRPLLTSPSLLPRSSLAPPSLLPHPSLAPPSLAPHPSRSPQALEDGLHAGGDQSPQG